MPKRKSSGSTKDAIPQVPQGFTRITSSPEEIWSDEAVTLFNGLRKESDERNPDFKDLYVSNDFYAYACADIITIELENFRTRCTPKKLATLETFQQLEGLTLWMASEDCYAQIDDGDMFCEFIQAFCAAWHTLACALVKANNFNTEFAVNLPNVILTVVSLVDEMNAIGDKISNVGESLQVLLCRAGLPYAKKGSIILGRDDSDDESDEDSEGDKENNGVAESDHGRPKKKAKKDDVIEAYAKMTHRKAENAMSMDDETTQYNFKKVWSGYMDNHGGFNFARMVTGMDYNISQWPPHLVQKYSYAD